LNLKITKVVKDASKRESDLQASLKKQLSAAIPPKCGYDKSQIQTLYTKVSQIVTQLG
jgi:hypothetical protein